MAGNVYLLERSHRTDWDEVRWWKKTTLNKSISLDQIAHEKTYSGIFMARETSSNESMGGFYQENMKRVGPFQVETNTATITTNDDVEGISENDIVWFNQRVWRFS